jgi:hypothetical protein
MKNYLSQPLKTRLAFHKAKPDARKYPAAYEYLDTNEPTGIHRDADGTAHTSNVGGVRLRFVGAADSILTRLQHKGWFVDGIRQEVTQGVVYRLPGNRGFLAGFSDPWNGEKDGSGPCNLEFSVYETAEDAARAGDRLAELYAERCRDDYRKQEAQFQLENAQENASNTRDEIRDLLAGIRESTLAPSVCRVLRERVKTLRRQYVAAIREARRIVENPWLLEE